MSPSNVRAGRQDSSFAAHVEYANVGEITAHATKTARDVRMANRPVLGKLGPRAIVSQRSVALIRDGTAEGRVLLSVLARSREAAAETAPPVLDADGREVRSAGGGAMRRPAIGSQR